MNKLKIFVCLAFILSASHLFSQSRLGIYAGLNSDKLSGDSPGRFKYVSSLNLAFGLGCHQINVTTGIKYFGVAVLF